MICEHNARVYGLELELIHIQGRDKRWKVSRQGYQYTMVPYNVIYILTLADTRGSYNPQYNTLMRARAANYLSSIRNSINQ